MSLLSSSDQERPANEVLDDLLKHGSISVVVELVEHRYRDRRRRATWAVLGGVATLLIGALGLAQREYTRREAGQAVIEQEEREVLARDLRVSTRRNELERAQTRLTFARTSQSFERRRPRPLSIDVPKTFTLRSGERRHFSFSDASAGNYVIQVDTAGDLTPDGIPLTPVLYLYRRTSGLADPIDFSSSRTLFFGYEEGATYYLEVEEILREPCELTLTVQARGLGSGTGDVR